MKTILLKTVLIAIIALFINTTATAQTFGSWVIPPYRIDFYDSGPVVTEITGPVLPYTCSGAGIKENGNLNFYMVNGDVFDAYSSEIGYVWDDPVQFELDIINVPGETNKFYTIGGRLIPYPTNSVIKYAMIDCSGSSPQISTVQDITTTTNVEHVSFAISGLNSNTRNLYIAKRGSYTGFLDKYLVDANGISFVETIVSSSDPILNDPSFFRSLSLEVNESESTIAWCSINEEHINIVNIDANGNFVSSSIININKGQVSGIEFYNKNGNNIIYASCNGNNGGIQKVNYVTGQITALTTNGSYGNTFLETASDGYIYAVSNNGENIGRIDPTTNTFEPSAISGLNINNDYSPSGYNIYKLPEDKTLYSPLGLEISSTNAGCPGSNSGTATANPIGGTPPYIYLWSPGGETTQTITNLDVGTYTCCVTDAVGDEICEDVEIDINLNLFDYNDEYVISYPVTITNWDKTFEKGIRISSGWEVTMIDCDLQFGKYGKIIIEPGATLTLDNCKMTNFAECGNMWVGVEVWGYRYKSQYINPNDNIQWQGKLIMKDETVIENAEIAVNLKKPGTWNIYEGGIVQATDVTFQNNARSVHARDYINYNPVNPSQHRDNLSYFSNCTFEINSSYIPDLDFYKHVDLSHVDGIKFKGCDFLLESDVVGVSQWNQAIAAYSAGFDVMAVCNLPIQPCTDYDECTFSGFNKAINAVNVNSIYTFWVNRAEFNNNTTGIYASNVNYLTVLFSTFNVGKNIADVEECESKGSKASGYGIDMTGCTGFAIEENDFTPGTTGGYFTGIRIAETQATDEVYKNSFDGLSYGNYAFGKNWYENETFKGLAYFCNENTGNWEDFAIAKNDDELGGVQGFIGNAVLPAGNTFTSNANFNFYNNGNYPIGYYYYAPEPGATNTPYYPEDVFQVAREEVIDIQNQCLSHYGGISGRDIVLTSGEKQQTEQEYATYLTDYNNVMALYDNLKDGGNTEATLTDVETAWPNDMWELRTELLGKSPHLSMDVLKAAADKTDVLPDNIIFEVMAANPDELKKDELIKYLEDKENPLPEYMVDILRQVSTGTTYKTVLQRQLAHYNHLKTRAANDVVRSILNDTVTDFDELRNWLDNVGGIRTDEQIITSYFQEANYNDALALASIMPSLYSYKENELTEHNYYMDMLNLQINLGQQGRNIFDLNSNEVDNLVFIANNSNGTAGTQAKGILEFAHGYHYCDCIDADTMGYKSSSNINYDAFNQAFGSEIEVYPNPANEWTAFNFALPDNETEGVIKISDVSGKVIKTFVVTGFQGQKVWDTRKIQAGVYFFTFTVNRFSKSGKIVISK